MAWLSEPIHVVACVQTCGSHSTFLNRCAQLATSLSWVNLLSPSSKNESFRALPMQETMSSFFSIGECSKKLSFTMQISPSVLIKKLTNQSTSFFFSSKDPLCTDHATWPHTRWVQSEAAPPPKPQTSTGGRVLTILLAPGLGPHYYRQIYHYRYFHCRSDRSDSGILPPSAGTIAKPLLIFFKDYWRIPQANRTIA